MKSESDFDRRRRCFRIGYIYILKFRKSGKKGDGRSRNDVFKMVIR